MNLREVEGKPLWRWLLVYVWLAMFGVIVFTVLSGAAVSARVGQRLAENPGVAERIVPLLEQKEPELTAKAKAIGIAGLQPAELERLRAYSARGLLTTSDRVFVHLVANLATFALLGVIAALFSQWRWSFLLVAGMLAYTTRPLTTLDMRLGSAFSTLALDAALQVGACYGAGWAALVLLGRKKAARKTARA